MLDPAGSDSRASRPEGTGGARTGLPRDGPPGRPTAAAILLYGIVFLAFVDNFALLPVLGPYARSLGATATGMGLVLAAYSVTNIAGNVLGGVLTDRLTPRVVLGSAFAACSTLLVAYAAVGTVGWLIAVRLAHGLAGGVLTPAVLTLVAGRSGPGLGRRMGRAGAAIGGAAVVAPAIAGIVRGTMGFAGVFVVVAVMLGSGLGLALAVRGPTGPSGSRASGSTSELRSPALLGAWTAIFGFTAALGTVATFLPDRVDLAGMGPSGGGVAFTLLAGVAVVVMLSPTSGRVDTAGPAGALMTGLAAFIVALLLAAAVVETWLLLLACVIFGLGFGLLFPAATAAVAHASSRGRRGRAFGGLAVCYSLGFVVGPPLSGLAADVGLADPFQAAAGVCAGCLAVVVWLTSTAPR